MVSYAAISYMYIPVPQPLTVATEMIVMSVVVCLSRQPMETEEPAPPPSRPRSSKSVLLPEVDTFLHLLVLVWLIDGKNLEKVRGKDTRAAWS